MRGNRDIALAYVRYFCAGDVDGLTDLLAPDLDFSGTLYRFQSRKDYLASLRRDPAAECGYRIHSVTEDADHAAVFYDYEKPDGAITVAQLFRIERQLIRKILVVFDGRSVSSPGPT